MVVRGRLLYAKQKKNYSRLYQIFDIFNVFIFQSQYQIRIISFHVPGWEIKSWSLFFLCFTKVCLIVSNGNSFHNQVSYPNCSPSLHYLINLSIFLFFSLMEFGVWSFLAKIKVKKIRFSNYYNIFLLFCVVVFFIARFMINVINFYDTNKILLAAFFILLHSIEYQVLFMCTFTWYSMLKCCIKFVSSPLLLLMLLTFYIYCILYIIFDNNNCCCCYSMLLNAYAKLLCCNIFRFLS